MVLKKRKLTKKLKKIILCLTFLIKHTKFLIIIKIILLLLSNKNFITFLKMFIWKQKYLKKKNIYKNKKLWKFLNFIIFYKIIKSKYFLEYKIFNKEKSLYFYETFENKFKHIKILSLSDFSKLNTIKSYKSFNLPYNLLKKKLLNKKYWFLWKLKEIKNLRYSQILIWPLIITIKPNNIIIKNIYFVNHIILTKKKKIMNLNKFVLNEFTNLGTFIWYIINKYIYLNYPYKVSINNIIKKYYVLQLLKKNNIICKYYNKGLVDKKYFYKLQLIYVNLRQHYFLGRLYFSRVYNLYFFWFLFFYNKKYYYYNYIIFIIWLRFNYFNLKLNNLIGENHFFFIFSWLYKKVKINYNNKLIEHNYFFLKNINIHQKIMMKQSIIIYYLNNILIYYFRAYFKYIFKLNYKKELNILDLYINDDYYKVKDYYKLDYFYKIKNIIEYKHNNTLPNFKNVLFLV